MDLNEIYEFATHLVNGRVCRICLQCNTNDEFTNDFSDNVVKTLNIICCIDISSKDVFPTALCSSCVTTIETFVQFKETCQTSDKKLQHWRQACQSLGVTCDDSNFDVQALVNQYTQSTAEQSQIPFDFIKGEVKLEYDFDDNFIKPDLNETDSSGDENLNLDFLRKEKYKKRKFKKKDITTDANSKKRKRKKKVKIEKSETVPSIAVDNKVEGIVPEDTPELLQLKETDYNKYLKEKKKRICPECNNLYKDNYFLNVHHRRVHLKHKPYMCDVCGHSFNEKTALEKHMRIHTDLKQYKCKLCEFCARLPLELQRHMNTHPTADRPHVCPVCGMSFRHRAHKSAHLKLHRTPFPYVCEYCDKKFKSRRCYKGHIEYKHKGVMKYQCSHCQKKFGYDASLRSHVLIVHGYRMSTLVEGQTPVHNNTTLQAMSTHLETK